MAKTNSHNTAKIAGMAAASAVAGAAAAMLLTPKTGKEVREKITEKANHAKDKSAEIAENADAIKMPE